MKLAGWMFLLTAAVALAQPPEGRPRRDGGGPPEGRPPVERMLHPGPPGRWWGDPQMSQKLGISSDQQKRMDDVFQQNRLKLIDVSATLQKEEATLEPLVAADTPDESRILSQIDRVAQARAELEKANARMLLGIRRILTADQWQKLRAERPPQGRRPPPPRDQE
jgi:Spy/CpxP family protein refolding chaperone